MTDDGSAAGRRSLADKLNHLFATVRGANQKSFSNHEVAAAINAKAEASGGPTIDQRRRRVVLP